MSSASLRLSSSLGKVIAASSSFATTKASSHALRSPLASPSSLKQHPLVVVVPLLNNLRARRRRDVNTKAINNGMTTRNFQFSEKIQISPKHVFLETPLSFAFVNLKPVVPGHVLVCPKRVVEKYEEMTGEEISDLMLASQKVAVGERCLFSDRRRRRRRLDCGFVRWILWTSFDDVGGLCYILVRSRVLSFVFLLPRDVLTFDDAFRLSARAPTNSLSFSLSLSQR